MVVHKPYHTHSIKALKKSKILAFADGLRGGKNYPKDTFSINPKLIRTIAKEAGVVVGGTLYSDAMGKQGSAGETYIGMMRENVLVIVGALN